MKELTIGSIVAKPGQITHGQLPVTKMASGHEVSISMHIIRGIEDGPCVALLAVQHGHEFSVINIQHRLLKLLSPQDLRGTVICIPVLNSIAFEWASRGAWSDGLWGPHGDIGRQWPGAAQGWLVERIAHAFASQVLPQVDVLLDFHGDAPHTRFTDHYVSYRDEGDGLGASTQALAYAFGMQIVLRTTGGLNSTLTGYAATQDIPALALELGDFYGLDLERDPQGVGQRQGLTEIGIRGIYNVLRHLNMLDGALELPQNQVEISDFVGIAPAYGGLMVPKVTRRDIGRVFPKGHILGQVIDPFTFEELCTLEAPLEQNILLAVRDAAPFTHMQPGGGDLGFSVANWSTATWIRGGPNAEIDH